MAREQPPREQEQSIRARKQLLFENDAAVQPVVERKERKPFAVHLRETPAAPLSGGAKALLWGAGAIVMLLLVATLLREPAPSATAQRAKAGSAKAAKAAKGPRKSPATARAAKLE
jgi:hypothetical protein